MGHTDASSVSERFVVTPEGEQWLENNPDFLDRLDAFYESRVDGQLKFAGLPHVGMGQSSIVHRAGDLAIKIATPSTGKDAWHYAANVKPENLFNQYAFLSELGVRLAGSDISVPKQYFALSGSNGYVRGEQFMRGWQSIGTFTANNSITGKERRDLTEHTKERVLKVLSGKAIKSCFDPHFDNLLIPEDTIDPETAPVCVIDQPSSVIGKNFVASFVARRLSLQKGRLSASHSLKLAA